jgi:hypothetical protein
MHSASYLGVARPLGAEQHDAGAQRQGLRHIALLGRRVHSNNCCRSAGTRVTGESRHARFAKGASSLVPVPIEAVFSSFLSGFIRRGTECEPSFSTAHTRLLTPDQL